MKSKFILLLIAAAAAIAVLPGCNHAGHSHTFDHDILQSQGMEATRFYDWSTHDGKQGAKMEVSIFGLGRVDPTKPRPGGDVYLYHVKFPGAGADGMERMLSLYNLAVQGRNFGGTLFAVKDGVTVKKEKKSGGLEPTQSAEHPVPGGKLYEWKVGKTGTKDWFGKPNPPKASGVHYLHFTGNECVFFYLSHRMWHSREAKSHHESGKAKSGQEVLASLAAKNLINKNHIEAITKILGNPSFGTRNGHDTTPPATEGGGENGDEGAGDAEP
jgi:hypothetical protein